MHGDWILLEQITCLGREEWHCERKHIQCGYAAVPEIGSKRKLKQMNPLRVDEVAWVIDVDEISTAFTFAFLYQRIAFKSVKIKVVL